MDITIHASLLVESGGMHCTTVGPVPARRAAADGDVAVVQEPTDQPSGVCDDAFRDPGHSHPYPRNALAGVDWSSHVIRVRQARVHGRTRKEAKTDEDHDMQTTGWAV
jgi:hypothetical protein